MIEKCWIRIGTFAGWKSISSRYTIITFKGFNQAVFANTISFLITFFSSFCTTFVTPLAIWKVILNSRSASITFCTIKFFFAGAFSSSFTASLIFGTFRIASTFLKLKTAISILKKENQYQNYLPLHSGKSKNSGAHDLHFVPEYFALQVHLPFSSHLPSSSDFS